MESRIPVPTDNIYKFYALFGLLLVVFSLGAVFYVVDSTNDKVFNTVPELSALHELPQPSAADKVKIALLERKLTIAQSNKDFLTGAAGVLCAMGLCIATFGFVKWHRDVQSHLDKLAQVQLEIAKLQLVKLQREVADAPPARVPALITSADKSEA